MSAHKTRRWSQRGRAHPIYRECSGFLVFSLRVAQLWIGRPLRPHGMIRRTLIALTVVGIIIAGALFLPRRKVRLRACGHPEDSWSRISRITGVRLGATHCCSSGSMINDMRTIDAAQSIYRDEHGTYATSFDQLTNAHLHSMGYTFRFSSDGQRWSVAVPRQDVFAGDYLFTSDFKVYFSTKGAATTNDLDLFDSTQR